MKLVSVMLCCAAIFFFDCRRERAPQIANASAANAVRDANGNQNAASNRLNADLTNSRQNQVTMANQKKAGDLEYEISIEKAGQTVSIKYRIRNTGKKSFLLFNRGISPNCETDRAFVEAGENGVVEIAQKLFRPPQNIECPALDAPIEQGVSLLKPAQTITENVRLSLPLRHDTPYNYCYTGAALPTIPQSVNKVRFCLGYFETDANQTEIEDCAIKKWQGNGEQKLLCSDVIELK